MSAPATTEFRLFIAVAVPEPVKDAIQAAQQRLLRAFPGRSVRWSRREQFHLTLRFLGNVPATRLEPLVQACQLACRPHPPLLLVAQGIGFFPNPRIPRVLWVGIHDSANQLSRVWNSVQSATQPFTSEAPEPEFTGHVTLGRINRIRREQAQDLAKAAGQFSETVFGEWTANRLELMRSELLPEGARHSVLAEIPLQGD